MSEVFLDTETTGLSFKDGHKVVEIACVETKDLIPTKNIFHKLINPKRNMPEEAFKIHGFSTESLKNKPKFYEIADDVKNGIHGTQLTDAIYGSSVGFRGDALVELERLSKSRKQNPEDKLEFKTADFEMDGVTIAEGTLRVGNVDYVNIKSGSNFAPSVGKLLKQIT